MSFLDDLGVGKALKDPVGALMMAAGAVTGQPWLMAMGYSHMQGKAASDAAAQSARDNAQARQVPVKSATGSRDIVYGRVKKAGTLLHVQNGGTTGEMLHVVQSLAGCQIDGVEAVWLNDITLPAGDASGYIRGGDYYQSNVQTEALTVTTNGTFTAAHAPSRIVSATYVASPYNNRDKKAKPCTATFSGTSITVSGVPAGSWSVVVRYEYDAAAPKVRVQSSLGSATNTAYADLITESGGKWTTAHKLNSVASIYCRMQYDQGLFGQTGLPVITAVIRGKPVYDPRENRLLQSCAIDQSPWTPLNSTVTANATAAPDGTTTADKIAETAVNSTHYVQQIIASVPAGQVYYVAHIKAAERTTAVVRIFTPATAYVYVNLTNGAITFESGTSSLSVCESAGNGWWRVIITATQAATGSVVAGVMCSDGVGNTYLGTAGSGVYVWGQAISTTRVGHTLTTTAARLPTTAWTQNPALHAADYLTTPKSMGGFGAGTYAADIDLVELTDSANNCDELVTTTAGGATQARYTCDIVLSTEAAPNDNMQQIIDCMAGSWGYVGGKWVIRSGRGRAAVMTIDESSLTENAISIDPEPPIDQAHNRVLSKYVEPTKGWAMVEASPVINATYLAEDGGIDLPMEISLPGVTDQIRSQRLAKIQLERSRAWLTVNLTCNARAYDCAPGEWVSVNLSRYGWVGKTFEVIDRKLDVLTLHVTLTLREIASTVFDWNYGMATVVDLTPNTTLPNALTPPAAISGLALLCDSTTLMPMPDGTFAPRVQLSWTQHTDVLVLSGGQIEIQWAHAAIDRWSAMIVPGNEIKSAIGPLEDAGVLVVRLRAINSSGRIGNWVTQTVNIVGQSTPPSDVSGLASAAVMGGVQISWTRPADADYARTELRVGATWAAGTLVDKGNGSNGFFWQQITSGTYTVWACHIDRTGNYSMNPASIAVLVGTSSLVLTACMGPSVVNEPTRYTQTATITTGGTPWLHLQVPGYPTNQVPLQVIVDVECSVTVTSITAAGLIGMQVSGLTNGTVSIPTGVQTVTGDTQPRVTIPATTVAGSQLRMATTFYIDGTQGGPFGVDVLPFASYAAGNTYTVQCTISQTLVKR